MAALVRGLNHRAASSSSRARRAWSGADWPRSSDTKANEGCRPRRGNCSAPSESDLGGKRPDQLALEVALDRLDGVRLAFGFVGADAHYAGEAQRHSCFILGTALDIVVPHFDYNLGADHDRAV